MFGMHLLAVDVMRWFPQKEERISTFCFMPLPLINKHLFGGPI